MSRNSQGSYNLPVSAFVPGTAIVAEDMNSNLDDIATALTQSVNLAGTAPMTASLRADDASASAPSYGFANSLGAGFYLNSTENGVAWVVASVSMVLFTSVSATTTLATYWARPVSFIGSVGFSAGVSFNNGISTTTTVTGDLAITNGLVVGFSGVPVTARIAIGDTNFFWNNDGLTPLLNFDANDQFKYIRASNSYDFTVNNVTVESIRATSAFYAGFISLPEITAPTSASANSSRFYARDTGLGTTRVYYKEEQGVELPTGGPGSWEEITSVTVAASAASVVFNLTKIYARIYVCGVSLSSTSNGTKTVAVEVSDDGGASYKAATAIGYGGTVGGLDASATTSSTVMRATGFVNTTDDFSFFAEFFAANTTAQPKPYVAQGSSFTDNVGGYAQGMIASMSEINAVRVRFTTGNIDAGTFTLYGEITT